MSIKFKEANVLEDYECIAYRDMNEYFKNLSKQKLISKATYSILHHPMLMLAKKYTIEENGKQREIKLTSDHIFLLCYIMGYVQDKCGSDSYYGSNKTLSKDLGVGVRTLQRRIKDLADVGFIRSCIDDGSNRCIFVNFARIMTEITKIVYKDYDGARVSRWCYSVAQSFSDKNLLEKSQVKSYTMYLLMQYLIELAKNPILEPVRFLYTTLAVQLKIDYSKVESDCERMRESYIREVNAQEN